MRKALVNVLDINEEIENTNSIKNIWKTYGYWAFWVGVAFFSVYPTCNWLTSERTEVYQLFFITELNIPFVPLFYWFYVSLYLLFFLPPFFLDVPRLKVLGKRIIIATIISGVIFILFPASLGFERVSPEGFYGQLFDTLFTLDLPHNMMPSLHVVYSALIIFAVMGSSKRRSIQGFALMWLVCICISTLLVHQHHLIDIVSAFALVWVVSKILIKGKTDV